MTVNETGTLTAASPGDVKVMELVYVPLVRFPVAADTVRIPLPVPEAGLSVSQAALSLADHVMEPPPVLEMFTVWEEGLAPPCCAAKDKLIGLRLITGATGGAGVEGSEEDDAGSTICVMPGISDINRPNCLGIVPVDVVPPEAAPMSVVFGEDTLAVTGDPEDRTELISGEDVP